jgi:hypothetical protein
MSTILPAATRPGSASPEVTGRASSPDVSRAVQFGEIVDTGERVGIFGAGGGGKTSLALKAPGPIAFFDLDKSLSKLRRGGADISHVKHVPVNSWKDITNALASPGWDSIKTIVIDSMTKASEMAEKYICETIPISQTSKAKRIIDYPYGKGSCYIYDEMNLLISSFLESHAMKGRNVVCICHESKGNVPNEIGDDYLRAEPLLPGSKSYNFRERFISWLDQLWYISMDMAISESGKATSKGGRVIRVAPRACYMSKTRTLKQAEYVYKEGDGSIWQEMLGQS